MVRLTHQDRAHGELSNAVVKLATARSGDAVGNGVFQFHARVVREIR